MDHYGKSQWILKHGRLFISYQGNRKELLSDKQVEMAAKKIYDEKPDLVGRAPAVYHILREKFWNVSLPKVRRGIRTSKAYTLQDHR